MASFGTLKGPPAEPRLPTNITLLTVGQTKEAKGFNKASPRMALGGFVTAFCRVAGGHSGKGKRLERCRCSGDVPHIGDGYGAVLSGDLNDCGCKRSFECVSRNFCYGGRHGNPYPKR